MNDANQLLREYARNGTETAFRELVTRYADLVYSAALRRLDGDRHRAEEVTQTVFTDLARKAATLPEKVMLGGWLHRHTGFVASNYVRTEIRRQAREKEAATMMIHESDEAGWQQVAPYLDEAIDRLESTDRDAIFLRYFEKRDLRSLGAFLGISEDAAQKRVSRAVDKLRELLMARGVVMTTALLGAFLADRAVLAAPAHLASSVGGKALENLTRTGLLAGLTALLSLGIFKVVMALLVVGSVVAVVNWPKPAAQEDHGAAVFRAKEGQKERKSLSPASEQPVANTISNDVAAVEVKTSFLALRFIAVTNGQAVKGVKVVMRKWEGEKLSKGDFLAGEDGVAEIPVARTNVTELELISQLDGYADTSLKWSPSKGEVVPESYTVKLEAAVTISGGVVDADGHPVAGARVSFRHERNPSLQGVTQTHEFGGIETQTDLEGRWKISRIASSMIRQLLGSASHPQHVRSLTVSARDAGVESGLRDGSYVFQLGRPVLVQGVVVDLAGDPVADAKILVGYQGASNNRKAVADANGRFEVAGCSPGISLITAEAEGFTAVTEEFEFKQDMDPIRLVLQKGKTLILRVVDKAERPIRGAYVWLDTFGDGEPGSKPVQSSFSPRTDADGRVVWNQAPDRELSFDFQATGYMRVDGVKVIPDGKEHQVVLPAALVLQGKVTDAESGELLPKFRIISGYPRKDSQAEQGHIPMWSSLERFWLTFGQGKYKYSFEEAVISGIPNPGYVFRFEAEGYAPFVTGVVPPDAGVVTLDVTLRRTQGHAVLVKLPDGRPAVDMEVGLVAPGASMRLAPGGFDKSAGHGYAALLRTDERGIFRLIADGKTERVVVADSSGYAEETATTLLNSPTLQIRPWGRVEGTFVSEGRPVVEAELRLDFHPLRWNTLALEFYTKTDAQGKFVYPQVPYGHLQVVRMVPSGPNTKTHVPLKRIVVRPGETTAVRLGGNTYGFQGNVSWPEAHQSTAKGRLGLVLVEEGVTLEEVFKGIYVSGVTRLAQEADGTWLGKDLLPGRYKLVAAGSALVSSEPLKLAPFRAHREIYLPEASSLSPIDFGTLELKPAEGQ